MYVYIYRERFVGFSKWCWKPRCQREYYKEIEGEEKETIKDKGKEKDKIRKKEKEKEKEKKLKL